jgi:putative superfamily III holin-X
MNDAKGGTSVFGLVKELGEEFKLFAKEEIQLAKTELSEKAAQFGRNTMALAIGGFIAYAGLILLLVGIGCVVAFGFQQLGLSTALAFAAGLGAVGLVIIAVGGGLVMKGAKAFSKQSLAPQRTMEALQKLKGSELAPEPKVPKPEETRTSSQIEESVLATENQMGQTLDELARRVTLRHARQVAQEEIELHPYRWGFVALGTGLASAFLLTRRLHAWKA